MKLLKQIIQELNEAMGQLGQAGRVTDRQAVVNSVADLKSLTRSSIGTDVVQTLYYRIPGDCGGGEFHYVGLPDSHGNDDVCFIVDASGGQWKRNVEEVLPEHGGAISFDNPADAISSTSPIKDSLAIFNTMVGYYEEGIYKIGTKSNRRYYLSDTLAINYNGDGLTFRGEIVLPVSTAATGISVTRDFVNTERIPTSGPIYVGNVRKGSSGVNTRWTGNPLGYDDVWSRDNSSNHTGILTADTDVGVLIPGGSNVWVEAGDVRGFTVGIMIRPKGTFAAYNTLRARRTFDCKFHGTIFSTDLTQWANQNRMGIVNCNNNSALDVATQGQYGYVLASDPVGNYVASNNIFEEMNFESSSGIVSNPNNQGEHVEVLIQRGRECKFEEIRLDDPARYIPVRIVDHIPDGANAESIGNLPAYHEIEFHRLWDETKLPEDNGFGNNIKAYGREQRIYARLEVNDLGSRWFPRTNTDCQVLGTDISLRGVLQSNRTTNASNHRVYPDFTDPDRPTLAVPDILRDAPACKIRLGDNRRGIIRIGAQGIGVRLSFLCFDDAGAVVNRAGTLPFNHQPVNGAGTFELANVTPFQFMTGPFGANGGVLHVGFGQGVKEVYVRFAGTRLYGFTVECIDMPEAEINQDGYRHKTVSQEPQSGWWQRGDHVWLDDGTPNPINGYTVQTNGLSAAVSGNWTAGMAVNVGEWINSIATGNEIWIVSTAGTGGLAGTNQPVAPANVGDTFTDNNGTIWIYMGTAAAITTFNQF